MWVAFRCKACVDSATGHKFDRDYFTVVDTEAQAKAILHRWQDDSTTYSAGIAPIADATEPHWVET